VSLSWNRSRLVRTLFTQHLFGIGSSTGSGPSAVSLPICKKEPTRKAAFSLLLELCDHNLDGYTELISLVLEFHRQDIQAQWPWNYSPTLIERGMSGYVGLKNMGATCYMNSITQQFFMIPSFRQAILESRDKEEDKENSLLHQLQALFIFLQESEQKAYDTAPFCHSFKDYEGNPMNTSVQMDVDEYFNMLFDRLENLLKGSLAEVLFFSSYSFLIIYFLYV